MKKSLNLIEKISKYEKISIIIKTCNKAMTKRSNSSCTVKRVASW